MLDIRSISGYKTSLELNKICVFILSGKKWFYFRYTSTSTDLFSVEVGQKIGKMEKRGTLIVFSSLPLISIWSFSLVLPLILAVLLSLASKASFEKLKLKFTSLFTSKSNLMNHTIIFLNNILRHNYFTHGSSSANISANCSTFASFPVTFMVFLFWPG